MPTALGTIASHRTAPATGGGLPMTGLVAWYDADDAATFDYSSGSNISLWRDKSGSNKHLNPSGNPTRSGTQNGHPTVVCSGSNSFTTTLWTAAVNNVAMIVALKETGGTNFRTPLMNGINAGYALALKNGANISVLLSGLAWVGSNTPSVLSAPVVYVMQRTSGTWTLHRDGVSIPLTSNATLAPNAPDSFSYMGTNFAGEIYEVAVYNTALTTVERQQVESYLKTKWGTP